LIELLVVIAVIAVLATLLLPGLIRARNQAWTVNCLGQMKQFSSAWLMYAGDNNDRIPPNQGALGRTFRAEDTWVHGWLELGVADWPDNINTRHLIDSHLGPYLSYSTEVWHCPADRSRTLQSGVLRPRVRSYSMNNYLNSTLDRVVNCKQSVENHPQGQRSDVAPALLDLRHHR
jgi:type II secretory pathway pseudopilin PulG